MDSRRLSKIARLIQKDLSELFQRSTQEMPGVIVSVTQVKPTPDLAFCRIYLSIFPSDRADEILAHYNKQRTTIRYDLGRSLGSQLRTIPELQFLLDDSLDYIDRIDALLATDKHKHPPHTSGDKDN